MMTFAALRGPSRRYRPPLFGVQRYDAPTGTWHDAPDLCNGDCMDDLAIQMLIVVVSKQWLRNLWATALGPALHSLARSLLNRRSRRCAALVATATASTDGGPTAAAPAADDPAAPATATATTATATTATTATATIAPAAPDGRTSADDLDRVAKLQHESELPPPRGLYWEYNEMAIQFGYLVMFAAAAPWAATLCLLNNAIERQSDAISMLYDRQRPPYAGASSIGAWAQIFELLCYGAIVTNVALLGVTSQSLTRMYGLPPSAVLVVCLVGEHALLLAKFYVAVKLDDTPLWVRKSEAYMQWLQESAHDGAGADGAAGAGGVVSAYRRHSEAIEAAHDDEEEDEEVSDLEDRLWL